MAGRVGGWPRWSMLMSQSPAVPVLHRPPWQRTVAGTLRGRRPVAPAGRGHRPGGDTHLHGDGPLTAKSPFEALKGDPLDICGEEKSPGAERYVPPTVCRMASTS
ncbi:hypothetical protein GCM10009575_060210 [Streptomyces rhizosphaericus]|uniref:Uncharacterized protein n=1 Tax=Streptomyces rhizosphaericus TaxID=114699 RepID=A0ABN1QIL5_9ACTN